MAKIITKKSERIRKPFKESEDQVGTNDIPDTQDTVEPTTDTDRIRLSCDITRSQHRKLRMEAARTDRTILQVVEDMIETHLGA